MEQAPHRRRGRATLRATLFWAGVLLALLIVGKLHACACTGGPGQWRSVYPTSAP